MTEEVKLEDLQKQILELQEQLKTSQAKADADAKKMTELEGDLRKARDLNADLFSRIPGGEQSGSQSGNGGPSLDDMSDEEFIAEAVDRLVDSIAHPKESKS